MPLFTGKQPPGSDASACLCRTDRTSALPKSIGGGTYAKVIPNIVAFGPIFPGDEVREHKPDEFIKIDELMQNAHILAEALYQLAK